MIMNCFTSQLELLCSLRSLHIPGGGPFQADVTYGSGAIHSGSAEPTLRFDIAPRYPHVQQADVRRLPLRSGSVTSVIFDPPFLAGGGKNSRMHKQYSSLGSVPELYRFYEEALCELLRILAPRGVLVFKCQDINNGRTQGFSHCEIYNAATRIGFYALDLFWVFKKCRKRNYRARCSA